MDASASVARIASALSWYLRLNPFASDTVEGIAQWWLSGDAFSLIDLAGALRAMELAGVIEAVRAADGQVRYRRTATDPGNDAQLDRFIAGS
jgi:hypothetical protein